MKENPSALLPIGVFAVLYLGLGIILEYVLKIPMGFYNIPIIVVFLIALGVACAQNPSLSFNEKLKVMAGGISDPNIITMIIIFLEAGIFVGVLGRSSAESVAYFLLSLIPAQLAVVMLFIISAFVSVSMGTSCGTITLIVPIAVAIANSAGFPVLLCIGTVVGGAMFGDNLSFISDTTIAACNGQGCEMKDKFRENFALAVPAALITLLILYLLSGQTDVSSLQVKDYNLLQMLPYLLVLAGGICGMNVFLVLLVGIITGLIITLSTGAMPPLEILAKMGAGAAGMFETSMVAILVSAICALIAVNGGFAAMISFIRSCFKGKRGGMLGIGLLVSAMDIATANNTVAIVMANPLAKEIAQHYGITPRQSASLLDTFSCIAQGIIPYGAQILIATALAVKLGCTLSTLQLLPYLVYPYALLLSSLVFIIWKGSKA